MGERARIARDLHDVVAHHVSAIAVQAESARLTTDGIPEEGRALRVDRADRATRWTEMRRLLGVLREDANGEPEREPQPSLARLNELVETARAAGSPVTLTLEGRVTPLPPGSISARTGSCRRRSRTRRHAPGAAVDVELDYADSAASASRPRAGLRLRIPTGTACSGCASGDHGRRHAHRRPRGRRRVRRRRACRSRAAA